MDSFAVILADPNARNPMLVAKALASVRKTPLQDQILVAKNGWGVLAENLSETDSKKLVQDLKNAGLETFSMASKSFIPLPDIKPAQTLDLLLANPPVLIAAAGITHTSKTTKLIKEGPSAGQKIMSTVILLGTGLPVNIGGKSRLVEKTQQHCDLVFHADFLYKDPWLRYRVDAQMFNYACLKERKQYYVLGNFKLLLADLVKAYPQAWTNHGARVLLEGKPVQSMGYESLTDLEKETRWLLALLDQV